MTIQDFIVTYNETFKYIECKYGVEAVKELWQTISEQWCTHLDELVKNKGLDGMVEYWGGEDGTLGREKAEYEISLKDGIFFGIMHECPSVKELHERDKKIYNGKLTYCDHCPALYSPVAKKYGIKMTFNIEHEENGECVGKCTWGAENNK